MKKNTFALIAALFCAFVMSATAYAAPSAVTVGDSLEPASNCEIYEAELSGYAEASRLGSYMPNDVSEATLCGESIYDVLANGMHQMESKIDISGFGISKSNPSALSEYFGNTLYMYPSLYYVSSQYTYWYNNSIITAVSPKYLVTDAGEISKVQMELENKIKEIVSYTNSSMTDIEKLLAVYDRIVLLGSYDDSYQMRTAKNLLLDGKSVCAGYASAFYAFATRLGIPCGFVRSEDMNHVWNAVCIDNTWYHVDVTWDDFSYADSLRVTHEYFLKSNTWMESEGDHYGFTFIEDNCEKYDDYFWNDAVSQIIILDNNMYYVDGTGTYGSVCCFDIITGAINKIYSYDSLWPTAAASRYYTGAYSGLALYDNRLYFNTHNEILSCNLDGTDIVSELLYEDTTNNSVYGCCIKDNKLHYVIGEKSSPYNITEKLFIVLYEVEEPDYSNILVTQKGTSMRVNDVTGMRFKATIEKESAASAYGWIVTREVLLEEAGIDPSAFSLDSSVEKASGFNYGYGVETAKIFESNDDHDCFTAIIYFSEAEEDGYPSAQKLSEKIVARPFAVVEGVTIYGDITEPVSVYDVALDIYNNADIYDALTNEAKLYISGVINKVGLLNLDS